MSPRVIDRVKKLLALASSDNPHEAAAALERAQALMAEHGLSADQVNASTEDPLVTGSVRSIATAVKLKDWEHLLMDRVAAAFGCELLFARGVKHGRGNARYAHFVFLGLALDVEVAVYASTVLLKQLARCRARFIRTTLRDMGDMGRWHKTREVDTYCMGWTAAAASKLQSMMDARVRAARAAQGETFALVVLSKEEQAKARRRALVEETVKGKAPPKVNRSQNGGSVESFEQGVRDGRQAQVHEGLKSGEQPVRGALP